MITITIWVSPALQTAEQLGDFLQTGRQSPGDDNGRRRRRKRDLGTDERQSEFMPHILSDYLTLILLRLSKEGHISRKYEWGGGRISS